MRCSSNSTIRPWWHPETGSGINLRA